MYIFHTTRKEELAMDNDPEPLGSTIFVQTLTRNRSGARGCVASLMK